MPAQLASSGPRSAELPVTTVLGLSDGRELAWTERGDPGGRPVFGFHGTPGSRLQLAGAHEAALEAGVRLVLPDRPGYGHSTFQPRRPLAGWAADVAAIADHLGIDRFAVVGVSGGGPHALACAAGLGPRVTEVRVASGAGSAAAPALLESLPGVARVLVRLPWLWLPVAWAVLWVYLRLYHAWPEPVLALGARWMPRRDAAIVARPDVRRRLLAEARIPPSPTAARAALQDIARFAAPWDLDLAAVTQPVTLWHGDGDTTVPLAHGRHLAEVLPDAHLHVLAGEGHLLFEERTAEVLAGLGA